MPELPELTASSPKDDRRDDGRFKVGGGRSAGEVTERSAPSLVVHKWFGDYLSASVDTLVLPTLVLLHAG